MATKEARQRATAKYEAKKYDKTLIRMDKGKKDEVQAHAQQFGKSLNGFINEAIDEKIKRDKEKQRKAPKPTPPDQMKLEDVSRNKENHK